MMASSAFQIMPEEVWEVILSKMDDSRDILNVFVAFPELNGSASLQKKKGEWLIDQVFLHVASLLNGNEILSCRRVSKRWSHAIDGYLENHRDQRPLDHERHIAGQVWTPTASPNHCSLRDHFRPITFTTVQSFVKFMDVMGNHSKDRNPFVGRCVRFKFESNRHRRHHRRYRSSCCSNDNPHWQMVMKLFRKFGKHVWFLEVIETDDNHLVDNWFNSFWDETRTRPSTDPTELIEKTIICFSHLPNLKKLSFTHSDIWPPVGGSIDEVLESYSFPSLPHLETFEMRYRTLDSLHPSLANKFIISYASSIRRLVLDVDCWKMDYDYTNFFPNLTELELTFIFEKESLNELLHSINAERLSSLKLNLSHSYDWIYENDILQWVRLFPLLKELHIWDMEQGASTLENSETLMITETDSIISLKSLVFIAPDLDYNYNFLRSFRSLEHLKVIIYHEKYPAEGPKENPFWGRMDEWCVAGNVYQLKIWEDLPKLRTLALVKDKYSDEIVFSYSRFHYESFKTRALAFQ